MDQLKVAGLLPILDGELLGVNPARLGGGETAGIDHFDGGLVVFTNWSRANLRETKFTKSRTNAHFAILAASTAARNSASALEAAETIGAWQGLAMTPGARRKKCGQQQSDDCEAGC